MATMPDGILYTFLILFLFMSALCSAMEIAYSSINVIRIRNYAKNKKRDISKKASKVYKVTEKYDQFLSTILILNNIANISASALISYIFTNIYNLGARGLLFSSIMITIIIIVFCEIIPKNIAKTRPETLALFFVRFVELSMILFWPITKLFSNINQKMVSLIEEERVTATENELIDIVDIIEKEGVLEQEESELIKSAIVFDSKSVQMTMKEKSMVINFNVTDNLEDVAQQILVHNYSRYPVLNQEGFVEGIINEQEVFRDLVNKTKKSLKNLIEEPVYVSYRRLLPYALQQLQRSRKHMAIVVDNLEEKNYLGIITLEDILEELVGEIYDEHDILPENIVKYGHHTYEVDGRTNVDDLFDYFKEAKNPYTKVKNIDIWVRNLLGKKKIKKGSKVNYDNLIIKILDIDKSVAFNNKNKIMIKKIEVTEETKIDKEKEN